MSRFAVRFAAHAAPRLLAESGQTVTWTSPGGVGSSITAILGDIRTMQQEDENEGEDEIHERLVTALSSDLTLGQGAKLTDDVGDWIYVRTEAVTETMTTVEVRRRVPTERSMAGYRRR